MPIARSNGCGATPVVARGQSAVRPASAANIAIRLIQVHLCIIYFFAGMAKLMGPAWWDGTAMWKAVASLEYQSLDMTWLAHWPCVLNVHDARHDLLGVVLLALIWPRLTRPIMLALAVPLHLGIALCLGMMTFGLAMLIANLAFVPPALVRGGWSIAARPPTRSRPATALARSPAGPVARAAAARIDRRRRPLGQWRPR